MKKILLTAVCAAALATPALADGWRGFDDGSSVSQGISIDQIGVNNGALAIQNGTTSKMEIDDDAFENVETGLDLGDLKYQNNYWIIGDYNSIDRVQNINDEVQGDAINSLEDVAVALKGGIAANNGGRVIALEIEDINVAVADQTAVIVDDIDVDLNPLD